MWVPFWVLHIFPISSLNFAKSLNYAMAWEPLHSDSWVAFVNPALLEQDLRGLGWIQLWLSGCFYFCFSTIFRKSWTHHTWTHLSMKEGSLFCFVLFCSYEIHRTQMLQIVFLASLESSLRGRVHELGSMTFELAMQKFLNSKWFLHFENSIQLNSIQS